MGLDVPSDYDAMVDDLIDDVRQEHQKSGRDIREILSAMRDEQYIDCTDEEFERIAAMALSNGDRGRG